MRTLFVCLALLTFVPACKKRDKDVADLPSPPMPTVTLPEDRPLAPDAVLVEVNGAKLLGRDAELELAARLDSSRQQIPPEQLSAARKQLLSEIVRQFIMRTLLLQEADRLEIAVTPEDEAKAYDMIRTNLPPGMTIEQVMKESPLGEERMKEEVTTGLKINKLLAERFTNQLEVTEQEMDDFIAENKERMTVPEHVQARHILITTEETDDDKTKDEKRQKAEKLREQLVAGADFAKLAMESSDCPSKEKGGDLGKFGRGQMVKPFEEAAFNQKVDEIGPVVETQFGYHIIQVTAHTPEGPVPREDVAKVLKSRKQQKMLIQFVEELKSKATITDGNAMEALSPEPSSSLHPTQDAAE